ncbi:serine hydrolase domain-containing protein [Hamadaea tsunoensis]|uniref:serine hydrolase domain-containing protein n=1 Tax=Hamadaea tsunoensis TaxID=53368 RepID=UPI000688CCC9|nr:serine hydrolase domain-containing protein [Hamadaea tsunoensis]
MFKILGVVTAAAVALSVPVPAYAAGSVAGGVVGGVAGSGVDEAAVRRVVEDFARSSGYPGIAYALTDGDRLLYADAYGDVTARTPMPIASLSKSFTALAAMQLVEAGRIELDAPAGRYLAGFRTADPRGAAITVRQLLNQTSGLSDRGFPEKSLPQPDTLAAAEQRVRGAKLAADPGTAYAYTNTNYHLVARIVEVVSGRPFDDYLRENVLRPAGMTSTFSIEQTPRDLPAGFPDGHVYAYGAAIGATEPKRFVGGSDGVVSTAEDMARWLILQHGQKSLASADSFRTMHTPAAGPHSTYAMGWQRDPDGRLHHNGIWFTYTASQLLLPDGHGVVVLGDSGVGLANEGTDALADELAAVLSGDRPGGFAPVRLITDLVLAVFTLLSIILGLRAVRRVVRGEPRPRWTVRRLARMVVRLWPVAVLLALPALVGVVFAGRDLTFGQLWYAGPALVVWLVAAAVVNLTVLGTSLARRWARPGRVG